MLNCPEHEKAHGLLLPGTSASWDSRARGTEAAREIKDMSDIYGPGLHGVAQYTRYARKQLDDSFELSRQIGLLDPNKEEDQKTINELTNRIQQMNIALNYSSDVLSLIIKLTQLPQ